MGVVITRTKEPFPALSRLLNAYDAEVRPPEVLCLGDSVMERVSNTDEDTAPLGQMISARLAPEPRTCVISHSAYNPRVYYHLCRVLKITRHRPKVVIVSVNLRCFSPQWDWNPLWQFDHAIDAIDRFLANPQDGPPLITAFPEVTSEQKHRFRDSRVTYPGVAYQTIGEFLDLIGTHPIRTATINERRRRIFVFHYMHRLTIEHRNLVYLLRLVDLLLEHGAKVLAYITPVNIGSAARLVGDSFAEELANNTRLIRQSILGSNDICDRRNHRMYNRIAFVDASTALAPNCFFHEYETTEHLNQHGRARLADMIVKGLRQSLLSEHIKR